MKRIYINDVTKRYTKNGEPWYEARYDDAIAAVAQSREEALGKLVTTHPDLFRITVVQK